LELKRELSRGVGKYKETKKDGIGRKDNGGIYLGV